MYVPGQYRQADDGWQAEILRGSPLALLVTNAVPDGTPYVTHLPVIPAGPHEAGDVGLVGSTLLGHLNRANPHWHALASTTGSVLVFTGPNGYVSPTLYGYEPAAPTWDYTAVHVHGTVTRIDSAEETLELVRATALAFERDFGAGWDMSTSIDYFRKLLPAVGGFRFTVSRVDSMFKLSQEQAPGVRTRVREHFAAHGCLAHRAAADLMGRLT